MPTAFEIAKELNDAGELEEELDAVMTILGTRNFTRGQIINYFEGIIGPLHARAWMRLKRPPTIEEFRSEISEYCTDTTRLIEHCMSSIDATGRHPLEIALGNLRKMNNLTWLDHLKKQDEENPSPESEED